MKAEIEHEQLIAYCQNLLGIPDSDLQEIWKKQYEDKTVSFLGIIDNFPKKQHPIIRVMIDWYCYHTWYDSGAYLSGLEVVLSPPLDSNAVNFETLQVSGILKSYERIASRDIESGCESVLRIFLERSSFDPSSPSDDRYQFGLGYTCD